jgi:hypothetical protein
VGRERGRVGVREVVGEVGRNDPNIVCTYELKKIIKKMKKITTVIWEAKKEISNVSSVEFCLCVPYIMK